MRGSLALVALAVAGSIGFGLAFVALNRDPQIAGTSSAIRKVEPTKATSEFRQTRPAAAAAAPAVRQPATGAAPELADPRWAREIAEPPAKSVAELADKLRGDLDQDAGSAETALSGSPPSEEQSGDAEPAAEPAARDAPVGEEQTAAIPAAANPKAAATSSRPPTRTARTSSDVRMRARPDNGAAVVTTVADGATVSVVDCKGWCEIVYGGKRGFIAAGFLDTPTASITRSPASAGARTKAKPAARAKTTVADVAPAAVPDPRTKLRIDDKHR